MFGPDFYPTPRAVAKTMLEKINRDAVHFLEPNAGKGDLAKAIMQAGTYGNPWGRGSRYRVDVIEAHPDLVQILKSHEGLSIVGYDWLTYAGVSYYDAIVMNPPFSQGANELHLPVTIGAQVVILDVVGNWYGLRVGAKGHEGGGMSRYQAGRALEYEIKALFEAAGWESIRGAGSKGSVDGFKTDLVFSKRSKQNIRTIYLVLMQAKRKKTKHSKTSKEEDL